MLARVSSKERKKARHAALQPAMRIHEIVYRFGALVIARRLRRNRSRRYTRPPNDAMNATAPYAAMRERNRVFISMLLRGPGQRGDSPFRIVNFPKEICCSASHVLT